MPQSNDRTYEDAMNDILAIYHQTEVEMLEKVAKRVAKGIKTEGWNESMLKDTQALNKELSSLMAKASSSVKKKMAKGAEDEYKKVTNATFKDLFNDVDAPMNLKQVVLAANGLIDDAGSKILRSANDSYQKVMANATTGLLTGTDTIKSSTQKMLNEYASKGITTFTDKAGRNWNLSTYAEMCARTVSAHAALQGHIDRSNELGEDLVKVSSIGTTCPICSKWQGVVLSISGKSLKYRSLDSAKADGLFHPNCKHTITMFIPELDGEGKVEPNEVKQTDQDQINYKLVEKQRSNERNIRYWKKRAAVALTPEEAAFCNEKIQYWQHTNLLHCTKNNLRRQYAREGNMVGYKDGPKGVTIGGTLKELEGLYSKVMGSSPKKAFNYFKLNLQYFASDDVTYEKWLKDEILDLTQLDIDKAMMKDSKNKDVTPTSLYKKYIGDTPMQDYAEVSEFEKGSKEYKSGYAKWLKEQIEDIGVSYKIKPQYIEVHEDIPEEDKKLSATELYKKYNNGKAPTVAYKELGGEASLGMGYGKWVETQKKELIKKGITKQIPFSNSTVAKSQAVVSKATQTIAKAKVDQKELDTYENDIKFKITGPYTASKQVKNIYSELKNAKTKGDANDVALLEAKYEIAKKVDLEINKEAAAKYTIFDLEAKIDDLKESLNIANSVGMEPETIEHIKAKLAVYEEQMKIVSASMPTPTPAPTPTPTTTTDSDKFKKKVNLIAQAEIQKELSTKAMLPDEDVIELCRTMKRSYDQKKEFEELDKQFEASIREMGFKGTLEKHRHGTCYWDIHDFAYDKKQEAIDNMKPWQAVGDYTSGSRPHNFAYKENQSAKDYFKGARYTREQAQQVDLVLDKAFEVPSATLNQTVTVRHANNFDGIVGLLGEDEDFETYSEDKFFKRLKELNEKTKNGESVILQETGYLSTSPASNGGFTNKTVEVRIVLPKGTKGLFVNEYSYYDHEVEIILKRNQKFKFVKGYAKGEDGFMKEKKNVGPLGSSAKCILYLEAIPDDDVQ